MDKNRPPHRHQSRSLVLALVVPLFIFSFPSESYTQNQDASADKREGWTLALRDNFDRPELGGNWIVQNGQWSVEQSSLNGSGTLLTSHGYPGDSFGYTRLEFEIEVTEPSDDKNTPVFGAFIHARPPKKASAPPWETGYFFELARPGSDECRIFRNGKEVARAKNNGVTFIPGKTYRIVIENAERTLRLYVNGALIAEWRDAAAFVANTDYNRAGFHFLSPVKIRNIRIYIKRLDDMDNFI